MNPSSEFAIDGHVVKTKVTMTEENFYQLKVIAYDSGSPSLSTEGKVYGANLTNLLLNKTCVFLFSM